MPSSAAKSLSVYPYISLDFLDFKLQILHIACNKKVRFGCKACFRPSLQVVVPSAVFGSAVGLVVADGLLALLIVEVLQARFEEMTFNPSDSNLPPSCKKRGNSIIKTFP